MPDHAAPAAERHPDAVLTLRECFAKHYDTTDLSARGLESLDHALKRWERLTEDPPVGDVDNETVTAFRTALLQTYAKTTARNTWKNLRSIFRRLAPDAAGFNPTGLGIIERVPYMKPVKVVPKRPYRIPLEDLDAFYRASEAATFPKLRGCPPAFWWQTLIVLAYFTGLRRRDLFSLTFSQFDLARMTLDIVAHKTEKDDRFPLHRLAAAHVKRIAKPPRPEVFHGVHTEGGLFTDRWRAVIEAAGIRRKFTLHDVRRTAASEIDRVDRGLGKALLQHTPRGVTEQSYLNVGEELAEALPQMRVPEAFADIDADGILGEGRDRRTDWTFDARGATWRGRRIPLRGRPLATLRAMVAAGRPLTFEDLRTAVFWDKPDISRTRIKTAVHQLRQALRKHLDLPSLWNPVAEAAQGAGWQLVLP